MSRSALALSRVGAEVPCMMRWCHLWALWCLEFVDVVGNLATIAPTSVFVYACREALMLCFVRKGEAARIFQLVKIALQLSFISCL